MSKLIQLSLKRASINKQKPSDFVLYGLQKKRVGYLIGLGGVGKTDLSISIATDVALGTNFTGLNCSSNPPLKVLYLAYEDGHEDIEERILNKQENFALSEIELLEQNFYHYSEEIPLIPKTTAVYQHSLELYELIETAKDFDLLVIDNARNCLSGQDDITGDIEFNIASNFLAKEADIAVLVTHHITKAKESNVDELTSSGGSGFSASQSKSKFILLAYKVNSSSHAMRSSSLKNKKDQILVRHLKANKLPPKDQYSIESPLILQTLNGNLLIDENKATKRTSKNEDNNPLSKVKGTTKTKASISKSIPFSEKLDDKDAARQVAEESLLNTPTTSQAAKQDKMLGLDKEEEFIPRSKRK